MSPSPRLTNIAKLGVGLAIASPVPWLLLLVLPFLPLSVAGRAIAGGGLLVVAEAMFWVGVMLAGQEVVRRSRDDNKVTRQTERDLKHLIPAENSSVYGV
jgi:hypothetical protein